MENFDPNVIWATKTVRLVLGMWKYRFTVDVEVGGNTIGVSNLNHAVESFAEQLIEDYNEGDDDARISIRMTDPDGETLICEPDRDNIEMWIESLIISAEIVKIVPEVP